MRLLDQDKITILADFLKMNEEELTLWSDGSLTIDRTHNTEYVLDTKKHSDRNLVGFHGGYYIYLS